MEADTFSGIKNLLQNSKQIGATKTDLFSHITEILNRIIEHHKYDAYAKFEEISMLIKKTQLNVKNPLTAEQIKTLDSDNANHELRKYINQLKSVLEGKHNLSKSDKQLVSKGHKCVLGDFMENIQMLQWAGISFGESESYRIYKSV